MSILTHELEQYLQEFLQVNNIPDYCPNGLQVEGKPKIQKIISGVTACQELLDRAVIEKADAIIVHHGYFWKNESPVIKGMKRKRIETLLKNNINLFAYHLPLDLHPVLGNNAQLARRLGIELTHHFNTPDGLALGCVGILPQPIKASEFSAHMYQKLEKMPLHIGNPQADIHRLAWCTGAAQSFITQALEEGVDAYISGEISESTTHVARENNMHFFAAGHHATERYGVMALGEYLAQEFGLEHQFIDIENPA